MNQDGILGVSGIAYQEPIAVGSGESGSVAAPGRWGPDRDVAFGLVASGLGGELVPSGWPALEKISSAAASDQVLVVGKEVVPEEQPVVGKAASLRASVAVCLGHDEKSELVEESGLEQAVHVTAVLAVQAEPGAEFDLEVTLGLQQGFVLELASDSGTGAGPADEEHLV